MLMILLLLGECLAVFTYIHVFEVSFKGGGGGDFPSPLRKSPDDGIGFCPSP